MEKSADKTNKAIQTDIVIFGAGIAGLWTFHRLKKLGYDVLLLERESIGCGQTIASQGIIHSGLKFSLAGKVNKLALIISKMPDIWRAALRGKGDVDLSTATINAQSQQLLIPSGFMGGLTKLVTERALGNNVHAIDKKNWPEDIKNAGFKGSLIFMDEPVLDIPSVIRALAQPYQSYIKKISNEEAEKPFGFLKNHNIHAKQIIFTGAASNQIIAEDCKDNKGLETQKRPLVQGIFKNAPFPLWGHLVGKTDKPVASITTHKTKDGELVWYIGGGAAERAKNAPSKDVYNACIKAFKTYLPNIDIDQMQWSTLPIDRIEGKSKTESWMPDTPTIHHGQNALYCWPTKLTFAPLLSDMILKTLKEKNITPSNIQNDFSFLNNANYTQTPWDTAQWKK
ncbi:MAG: FAD-dependent oxidoreductase [Alphaproteobacteria bacterium]